MSDDLVQQPAWAAAVTAPPPPSLLDADVEHIALSERRDPLDEGFVLAGGVLAPLPPKVRLPHEDDEEADDEGGQPVDV
jgi:hypothetical protein